MVKYAFIESLRNEHAVTKMCRWAHVSRSGYYKWRSRKPSETELRRLDAERQLINLFSRKIIGWSLGTTMANQLIMDAFKMAVASRDVEPGLILHSDRGVQYRSWEYQQLLLDEKIRPSMSRKGNCWDNAVMESFFARFKVEALYTEDVTTKKEAYSCVFDYIELFYNSHRRHSTLGYKSPNHFEAAYEKMCA